MSLFFREEGRGTPVLLVHGLGASGRVFDQVIAAGRDAFRFVVVDLPCHGRSGPWAPSTPAAIAEGLAHLVQEHALERFGLFGHSFGGLVALELALRVPERVTMLAVASTPSLGVSSEVRLLLANPFVDFTAAWMMPFVAQRPLMRRYLRWLRGSAAPLTDEILDHYLEAARAQGFSSSMMEASRAVASYRFPDGLLREAPFRRRVLWGALDRLVSLEHGEALAKIMGAELLVLPDVGHCVPEEAPSAVFAAIS